MIDQLRRPGMTKRQVIFVNGTPLVLRTPFDQDRWELYL